MAVIFTIILLLLMLALGVPVAFALAISGSVGLLITENFQTLLTLLSTGPYSHVASFTLTTIPMFILMAELSSKGNMAKAMFDLTTRWLGHVKAGTALSVIFASAGFGAMCGSSVAGAAAMSRIACPELLRIGYSPKVAGSIVAVAGTLAIMIPPSIPMVIYGISTETSIGKLLIAGILPGMMTAFLYACGVYAWAFISKEAMPTLPRASWRERVLALRNIWPFALLIAVVVFGLYSGLATATEVAALGALGALLIGVVMRRLDARSIIDAVKSTIFTTTMIFSIIIGATIFGYFLTITQTSQNLIDLIAHAGYPSWVVLTLIVVMYIVLGCFMDQVAILLITLPLTFPLIIGLGYNEIWFGVIVVKLVEIGLVTPPLGMNAYVVSSVSNIPLHEIFRGLSLMLALEAISLVMLILFPSISLFLPSLM